MRKFEKYKNTEKSKTQKYVLFLFSCSDYVCYVYYVSFGMQLSPNEEKSF